MEQIKIGILAITALGNVNPNLLVFELEIHIGHTDGQTDRQIGKTHNVAYLEGCII